MFNILMCPHCDGENLHQNRVKVYARFEDAPTKILETDHGGEEMRITADNNKENPSSRRDATVIIFDCEGCEKLSHLQIIQHKGVTLVEWESKKSKKLKFR